MRTTGDGDFRMLQRAITGTSIAEVKKEVESDKKAKLVDGPSPELSLESVTLELADYRNRYVIMFQFTDGENLYYYRGLKLPCGTPLEEVIRGLQDLASDLKNRF